MGKPLETGSSLLIAWGRREGLLMGVRFLLGGDGSVLALVALLCDYIKTC